MLALDANKQARALTRALLRQLSTWPSQSDTSTESIPPNWEQDLRIGRAAEEKCRTKIKDWIVSYWSQPSDLLPESSADFARYGPAAYDVAKGSPIKRESPVCSASSSTGTKPAADTRFGSSNTADPTTNICDDCTGNAFRNGDYFDFSNRYCPSSFLKERGRSRPTARLVFRLFASFLILAGASK